eukprot:scaffold143902_cov15-Tisochrysis_lutea.AAC.1
MLIFFKRRKASGKKTKGWNSTSLHFAWISCSSTMRNIDSRTALEEGSHCAPAHSSAFQQACFEYSFGQSQCGQGTQPGLNYSIASVQNFHQTHFE